MTRENTPFDLDRFVEAQEADYETALRELNQGEKVSHWIWYIFPQLAELGYSYRAKYYGIEGLEEARAYMNHPVLGPRYLTCVEALLQHQGHSIEEIMGGDVDAKKLRSSLTLMLAAGGGERVEATLNAFYSGQRCHETSRSVDHVF
jgi:uncharacterized protein (DUF1810 family)